MNNSTWKTLLDFLKVPSLRRQIVLVTLLISIAMVTVTGYFFTQQAIDRLENNFQLQIEKLAAQIIPELEYPLLTENREIFKRVTRDYLKESLIKGIAVLNKDGKIIYKQGISTPKQDDSAYGTFRKVIQEQGVFVDDIGNISSSKGSQTAILGWIELVYTRDGLAKDKARLLIINFLIALAVILSGFIAYYVASKRFLDPYARLRNELDSLSHSQKFTEIRGNYPTEVETAKDSINHLISMMHHMYSDVDEKLNDATRELTVALNEMKSKNFELDQANQKSMEAVRIKSEFMANMSHELRTPMNGIIGFTDLLLKSNLTDQQLEYTQTVRTSASNLLSIINDILDFTKLESGELHIENHDFNLRDVIEDVISYLSASAYDKGLEIVNIYYGDAPESIYSDPVRIRQVVTNLLANAIKFTKKGHIVIRTMLEEEHDNGLELKISVQDTGIGLSLKDQEKLFTAFSQADTTTTRKFGGVGVGLVICREIADRLNGSIGLDSKLGSGSTFWFGFQCTRSSGSFDRGAYKYNIKPGFKALLYDSQVLSRNAIMHIVKGINISLDETNSPDQVTRMVNDARDRGEPYHTIILGLNNHELLNNELTEILANIKDEHHYTFLVLVNSTNKEILDECYRLGADICLPKSAKRKEILNAITDTIPPHLNRTDSFRLDNPVQDEKGLDLSSVKILVVDDNEINRKLVVSILKKYNADVIEASSGQAAITEASSHFFDLIFMDIHMPEMNGIEATKAIRLIEPSGRRTPVIALTANAVRGERERLMRSGLDGCIIKPIKPEEISDILHKWVDDSKIRYRKYRNPVPRQDYRGTGDTYSRNILNQDETQLKSLQFANENPQLVNDLKKMFIDEIPKLKVSIKTAYDSGNLEQLIEEAHRIHGAAACCAMLDIKTAAQDLENLASREKHDQIDSAYTRLVQVMETHS